MGDIIIAIFGIPLLCSWNIKEHCSSSREVLISMILVAALIDLGTLRTSINASMVMLRCNLVSRDWLLSLTRCSQVQLQLQWLNSESCQGAPAAKSLSVYHCRTAISWAFFFFASFRTQHSLANPTQSMRVLLKSTITWRTISALLLLHKQIQERPSPTYNAQRWKLNAGSSGFSRHGPETPGCIVMES